MALQEDEPRIATGWLADWDPSADIRLCRTLQVDWPVAASDVRLRKDDLRLSAIACAGTGPGRLPRRYVHKEEIPIERTDTLIEFEFVLPSRKLAGAIDVSTEIVLAEAPAWPDPLSPARTGDKVWFDRCRVALDAEALRFPMEIADLRNVLRHQPGANAPWYLDWSPHDWTRDLHGALRLYLNSRFEEVVTRVRDGDRLTLQAIMADVIGQVCERFVLATRRHEILDTWEDGTIGAQAQAWLESVWRGDDVGHWVSMLENDPGKFRAAILAFTDLGKPVE